MRPQEQTSAFSNLTSNNFPFLWSGFLSRKELICTSVSLFLSLYDESMKPPLNCNESVMTDGRAADEGHAVVLVVVRHGINR